MIPDYFKDNMNRTEPAIAVIDYADKSFLGLMLPDGEFRISLTEILTLFFDCQKLSLSQIESRMEMKIPEYKEVSTYLDKNKLTTFSLDVLKAIAVTLARKNVNNKTYTDAIRFVQEMESLSVEQAFLYGFKARYPLSI